MFHLLNQQYSFTRPNKEAEVRIKGKQELYKICKNQIKNDIYLFKQFFCRNKIRCF